MPAIGKPMAIISALHRCSGTRCRQQSGSPQSPVATLRGGFSFYLDRQPEFEKLVVALGRPPETVYVAARVVNVTSVVRNEMTMFRVGCGFSHRMFPDAEEQKAGIRD